MRCTFLWLIFLAVWPGPAAAQVRITVTLYDQFGLVRSTREKMKSEASRIFEEAGAGLDWVECEVADRPMNLAACAQPLGPSRFMLQLVPGGNKARPAASGLAVIQGGASVYACVYPRRVEKLARDAKWDFGDLLGHAAAHELGHLLLRSSGHSPAGIMRAPWEAEDLRRLSHAGLIFLPGQLRAVAAAGNRE